MFAQLFSHEPQDIQNAFCPQGRGLEMAPSHGAAVASLGLGVPRTGALSPSCPDLWPLTLLGQGG